MAQPTDDTKFDLCANSVTLDYDALKRVALVAVRHCLEDLRRRLNTWYEIGKYPTDSAAQWMLEDAQDLHIATVALHYLHEGMDREEVKITRAETKRGE